MSRLSIETCRALRDLERDMGNLTITWKGQTFVCIPHTNALSKMLIAGGFTPTGATGFVIRASLFTGTEIPLLPEFGNTVTGPAGENLRVSNVNTSADGAFVYIECVSIDHSA